MSTSMKQRLSLHIEERSLLDKIQNDTPTEHYNRPLLITSNKQSAIVTVSIACFVLLSLTMCLFVFNNATKQQIFEPNALKKAVVEATEIARQDRYIKRGLQPPSALLYSILHNTHTKSPYMLAFPSDVWGSDFNAIDIGRRPANKAHDVTLTTFVDKIFYRYCNKNQIMFDGGSHIGYYSMMAASHGCQVISVEPAREMIAWQKVSLALNGFNHSSYNMYAGALSDTQEVSFDNWNACHGVECKELNFNIPDVADSRFSTTTFRVDDLVNKDVLLLKLTLEGYERHGFLSSHNLLRRNKVSFILSDYTFYIKGRYISGTRDYMIMLFELKYRFYFIVGEPYLLYVADLNHYLDHLEDKCRELQSRGTTYCQAKFLAIHRTELLFEGVQTKEWIQ